MKYPDSVGDPLAYLMLKGNNCDKSDPKYQSSAAFDPSPMEFETYYESSIGVVISANRAREEVELHCSSWQAFIQERGLHETYLAHEVLEYLGY